MLAQLAQKIFGSKNERELKRIKPIVQEIAAHEPTLKELSVEELRAKTDLFRERIREATHATRAQLDTARGELNTDSEQRDRPDEAYNIDLEHLQEDVDRLEKEMRDVEADILDTILPEAYATVREVSRRVTGMRHYDSQMIGGIVLHQGRISEMKTGEGKTLVATLPLYLNALLGHGAHLVTVNDYLARRDVQWMGPIYHTLGLSTSSVVHDTSFIFDPEHTVNDYRFVNLRPVSRKESFNADITYGTNNEYGFDYLRDNMKFDLNEYVQRKLHFSIVDEVDNILIDEARTPLIISGPTDESTDKYYSLNRVIPRLQDDSDYSVDEKLKAATLTEEGVAKVERILGVRNLYDPTEIGTLHHVNQALKAHAIFKRDVDYVVKDGEVMIVDEFTGRLMPGRRWSDGLHQAVEAKEGVKIREENQTLATITIQNYFRMYHKLCGMTGTADTEAVEFKKIYDLDVAVIPPNKPMVRADHADVVYKTEKEKFQAAIDDIVECHKRGQPVLVGTVSVEKSEHLSKLLKRQGVKHNVLNAVNHEAEANIIAQAGRFGGVTIATNMAGRGTDILLGGNPEFLAQAEIEKQWVNKASASQSDKGSKKAPGKTKGYEEELEEIRSDYNSMKTQAEKKYQPLWAPYEMERNEALKRMTETYRPYLLATVGKTRDEFLSCSENITKAESILSTEELSRFASNREAYELALAEYDKVIGPVLSDDQRNALNESRDDLTALLASEGNFNENKERMQLAAHRCETSLESYNQSLLQVSVNAENVGSSSIVSFEDARDSYQESQKQYKKADSQYDGARKPYEEAMAEAERIYEEKRKAHQKVLEEVRARLEKEPNLYQQNFDGLQEKYEAICEEERNQVVAAGGVHILGTERHESRRIDNQLRGRAGRQGDPGSSRFYLSLEDDLLRIFGAERVQKIMDRLGMEEGEPIEHTLVTRAIENAQGRVEGHNFDIRKHLLEYDDVINKQREVIYEQRRRFLAGEGVREQILGIAKDLAAEDVGTYAEADPSSEDGDWKGLDETLFRHFNMRLDITDEDKSALGTQELQETVSDRVVAQYTEREQNFTPPVMRYLEKVIMLQTMDALWKDHLLSMDHLKEGIGLRGYAQKNPLQEYKKEAYDLFDDLSRRMEEDVIEKLYTVQVGRREDVEKLEQQQGGGPPLSTNDSSSRPALPRKHNTLPGARVPGVSNQVQTSHVQTVRDTPKVGRNDPCPCGSGKKYKKCHGK